MDNKKSNRSLKKLLIFLLILVALALFSHFYIDWLWFSSLDFQSIFATTIISKIVLYVVVFLFAFLFIWLNLQLTRKYKNTNKRPTQTDDGQEIIYLHEEISSWTRFLEGKASRWVYIIISLFLAYVVSSTLTDQWIVVQQFINKVPFGKVDPIFNKDLGFYFFNLTFYKLVYRTLMITLVLTLITVSVLYMAGATAELFALDWKKFTLAKSHVAVLLASIFALKAWGYQMAAYGVLTSSHGVVFGATYTDINARLLAYKVLMLVALLVAIMIVINIFVKRVNWILYSIGTWLLVSIILGGIYPGLMQKFIVQPDEFNKEKPYLQTAIKMTREAYELNEVDNREFKIDYNLTMEDINNNRPTVDNIRLWDWEPLKDTYKNLQELRPYYTFNDVDIDRYVIDGRYQQVMLSAREMEDIYESPGMSPAAKTWINQRLMYTHGYGLVMSPVTEIAQEGFPHFYMKDIPPQFSTDLKIKKPGIYFGEKTDNYVLVNAKQKEFDYPMGAENVYTNYEGNRGIKINSIARRLLLSWELKDYKMIFASNITNDSQVLMNRNIIDRTQKIAPYLAYDNDPYIVIGDDGKLYWMMDAYTYGNKYPYSQPFDDNGNNYIRNSVKIICDAYTGELSFYVANTNDPIIKTYQKIFPRLYKDIEKMPEDLKAHIRYPEDMFSIQAEIYRNFHISDPWVFYNKEDSWVLPNEIVEGKETILKPYYIIMRLPGEAKEEYILMLPYTPNGRNNMIAWMCARMDGDNYGKKLVYRFPKQETVYGPMQIESRINQNPEISSQLALWNRGGSSTYRGNILVIPINNSILYIEPLYLQAQASKMPELKRVIAAYGNTVVMEENLENALVKIFGGQLNKPQEPPEEPSGDTAFDQTQLTKLARKYYDQANQALKQGDWAGYGENLKKLNDVIKEMEKHLEQ
ncbi:Uncharacterised protein family UPF0182 [Syntrophomonas zehnderi OL-4]|uniref:UPF0182 protein 43 n=1 Tax=Syntrophomonas zehnderi OL-4 TaxID=690567 RepID=A0A0E3W2E7_9FIRM|nr:UPF0182 family protein [Syntrophomonas zehnderi]CFW96573.1 Uncharacterised protein family UPF0182 [Syntrophomonas zehnderi OL-4]